MKQLMSSLIMVVALLAVVAAAEEGPATLESLTRDLSNPDAQVRSSACYSLGRMGAKARPAAPEIGSLLIRDESPSVRQMAASTLGDIALHTLQLPEDGDSILVGLLAKAMRDTHADVRFMAAQAIGKFMKRADSATLSIAVVATSDGDRRVRKAAVRSLGMIGRGGGIESRKAVPYLTKALSDPDPEICRLAAYVLSAFGKTSLPALENLIEALRDGSPQTQKEAARTLGGHGSAAISAVPLLLEKVKQERHLELRGDAGKAVVRIDPSKLTTVVNVLKKSTHSKDSGIRMFALDALLKIDKERRHIVSTLKRLTNDEIVEIQLMAAEAMEDVMEIENEARRTLISPTDQNVVGVKPEVTFQDASAADADAALSMLRNFLKLWQDKEYTEAEALVDERLRLAWRKQIEGRPMRLKSIDDIRVFKYKDTLRARAHISTAPKGGLGLDLMFHDGKWWMSGG